jgi:hypothetical protein
LPPKELTIRKSQWISTRRSPKLGAKSLDTAIRIQSEYGRTSYTDFASQGTKMRELYSDLAKACFKPIELTMPNMQGTK